MGVVYLGVAEDDRLVAAGRLAGINAQATAPPPQPHRRDRVQLTRRVRARGHAVMVNMRALTRLAETTASRTDSAISNEFLAADITLSLGCL
jgi:hypothetical protein